MEQLRTWTSNTGIWVLQREAKTQDVVEGFVAEMPHRILLSYNLLFALILLNFEWEQVLDTKGNKVLDRKVNHSWF